MAVVPCLELKMYSVGSLDSFLFVEALLAGLTAGIVVRNLSTGRLNITTGGGRVRAKWAPEWMLPFINLVLTGANWIVGTLVLLVYSMFGAALPTDFLNILGITVLVAWVDARQRTVQSNKNESQLLPYRPETKVLLALSLMMAIHQPIERHLTNQWVLLGLFLLFSWSCYEWLEKAGGRAFDRYTKY